MPFIERRLATVRKKQLTLEEHVMMGQAIKDAVIAIRKVLQLGQDLDVLTAREVDRLIAAADHNPALEKLRCRLDDQLFDDCPWVTNDAFDVYYHENEQADANELRKLAGRDALE